VTPVPCRGRCWPHRARPPTVPARPRIVPRGAPVFGRNGTSTPAAPSTKDKAAGAAVSGSGGGPCPRTSASTSAWRCAMAGGPAACTTPHPARGLTTLPPDQPSTRAAGGTRPKDRARPAQALACSAGPLRRHPQRLRHRDRLWQVTTVRAPSDAASPSERPTQARALARGPALAPQGPPARGAGGPGGRALGTCGAYIVAEVEGQDRRERPHSHKQLGERVGLCDRPKQLWHAGIIMPSAVAEA
jgi:hypothetical protein